jgi:hypothetical protein
MMMDMVTPEQVEHDDQAEREVDGAWRPLRRLRGMNSVSSMAKDSAMMGPAVKKGVAV